MEIKFSGTVVEIKRDIAQFLGLDMNALHSVETKVEVLMPVSKAGMFENMNKPAEEKSEPKPEKKAAPKKEKAPEKVEEPKAPPIPSEKEVQDAVVAVNGKFGIDKAIECLTKFQVKRARELREDQRADFIAHCTQVLA